MIPRMSRSPSLASILRSKFLVSMAVGAVTAAHVSRLEERSHCVEVVGDWCFPGLLECCDDSGTCTVDGDGVAVSPQS